jgi:sensor histidine kinase YesM
MALAAASIAAVDPAPPNALRAEFFRVFNLRSIGLVAGFSLLVVLSKWIVMPAVEPMSFWKWFSSGALFLRQNLISGLTMLAAVALTHALAVTRAWSGRRALVVGVLAGFLAALLGALLRLMAYATPWSEVPQRWPWALGIVALWGLVGTAAVALLHSMREHRAAQRALIDAQRARENLNAQHLQATLSALRAQIEPHFLFNTLANVKRLYETAPERGRAMLGSLIAYLRAALPSLRRDGSTVRQELALARSYLTILQMRMGERLAFDIEAEPAVLDAELPPLVLPTLLENAIEHGLSPLPQGGRIEMRIALAGDLLQLEVSDNGQGLTAGRGGSGVGLVNTRARLAALYGGRAGLTLAANPSGGAIARVVLPLRRSGQTG